MTIQQAVFVKEQGIPEILTLDEINDRATHVIAFSEDTAVGTARLDIGTGPGRIVATIARVAVLPEHRGTGLGKKMIFELEALGRRAGVQIFVLRPHDYLEPFYAGLGYGRLPDEDHVVAGHRLITMEKKVTVPI